MLSALIDTSIYEEALALREADPAVQTAKVEDLRSIREIKYRPGSAIWRWRKTMTGCTR